MSEQVTIRLDEAVYGRLSDAAKTRAMGVSSVVRQAVMAHLEGASGTAPTAVPPHTPEDCLAVVIGHASPVAQRRLAEAFARLDRIRTRQRCTRLRLVAETLALWAARVEPRAHAADESPPSETMGPWAQRQGMDRSARAGWAQFYIPADRLTARAPPRA